MVYQVSESEHYNILTTDKIEISSLAIYQKRFRHLPQTSKLTHFFQGPQLILLRKFFVHRKHDVIKAWVGLWLRGVAHHREHLPEQAVCVRGLPSILLYYPEIQKSTTLEYNNINCRGVGSCSRLLCNITFRQ